MIQVINLLRQNWIEPVIEEQFAPDRMVLTLEFIKTSDKKTSEEGR